MPRRTQPSWTPPTVACSSTSGSTSRFIPSQSERTQHSANRRTISTFSSVIWSEVSRRRAEGELGRRPADRQRLQLVEEGRDGRLGLPGELHLGEAPDGLLEEDLELEPRQRRAEAGVAAGRAAGLVLGGGVDVGADRVPE